MRFSCGACGYEFSTVRGSPLSFHVVAAPGSRPARAVECPECRSLVFPFGRGLQQREVETLAPIGARLASRRRPALEALLSYLAAVAAFTDVA